MRQTFADNLFDILNYVFLTCCLIIVGYPLLYIVSASFSSAQAVIAGKVWLWPVDISFNAYSAIFESPRIGSGYFNSAYYTVVGTAINIFITTLAAYPLSRKDFYGRNLIMAIFVFTMLFSGGLIPTYLLIKQLRLLGTRWAMVIPNALGIWNVILMRTYFQHNIPDELYEAAQIDGCRDSQFLVRIALPLSAPIMAVMTLFYAVGHWNSYFDALIYLSKSELMPLQIVLRDILIQNQFDPAMIQTTDVRELSRMQDLKDLLKYALIVVASAPVMAMYPFVQKYFVRGIMLGAIKG
jgi:putative aldouronate transport system permease protein